MATYAAAAAVVSGSLSPSAVIPLAVAVGAVGAVVIGNQLNITIHELKHKINDPDFHQECNGVVQDKPLLREARASFISPFEAQNHDVMDDEDWMKVPHIRAICNYAYHRDTLLSYYWTERFIILNRMYLDWIHSLPVQSSIHNEGNYAQVFVELHLDHFKPGLYGWSKNKFTF